MKIKKVSCFWGHDYDEWEQLEPYKVYACDTSIKFNRDNAYLYYTIYKQQRTCINCGYVDIESRRINNY